MRRCINLGNENSDAGHIKFSTILSTDMPLSALGGTLHPFFEKESFTE